MYDDQVIYWDDSTNPGGLYRANYVIRADGGVDISNIEQVREVTTYEVVAPASFTVEDFEVSGGVVRYYGKLFEAGEYPDKNFKLSESEQATAAADFTSPIPGNYEHKRGFLDGELGRLVEVKTDGPVLFGAYEVPLWLHEKSGGKLKASLEWNRATKKIVGVALTKNPRISDSELVAAFSMTHVEGKPSDSETERKGQQPMKEGLLTKLKAFFTGLSPEEIDDLKAETPKAEFTEDPKVAELQAENERLKAQLSAGVVKFDNSTRISEAAEKFVDDLISEDRVTPAEKAGLISTFAALADADFGDTAEFTSTPESGLLASFIATQKARPVIGLQAEGLTGKNILPTGQESKDAEFSGPDLLSMTPLGLRAKALKAGKTK